VHHESHVDDVEQEEREGDREEHRVSRVPRQEGPGARKLTGATTVFLKLTYVGLSFSAQNSKRMLKFETPYADIARLCRP
jgi:hypothetical protein